MEVGTQCHGTNEEDLAKTTEENEETASDLDAAVEPVNPKELLLQLGLKPDDVIPYPSLAVTRNTNRQIRNTKQLLSRIYSQTNGHADTLADKQPNIIHEEILPLPNGGDFTHYINTNLYKTKSLPAWPSVLPENVVKYGRKGTMSQKRCKRVVISENAQPKVSEGFWQNKGVFRHPRQPIQDRLPPRSKSHIGFPRSATSMRQRRELPDRPHTSDMTGYVSKTLLRNTPNGVDPDLINPRLLLDVLESENVTVNAKDIYNPSGWKYVRDSHVPSPDPYTFDCRLKDASAAHLKRALRPKHGTQRIKGDNEMKLLESRYSRNRSPERQVTSTPDESQNPKNRLYSRVMLTINNPGLKIKTDDKSTDKSSSKNTQVKKGHCLKSPRLLETFKSKRNTTVVPINLKSKESKAPMSNKFNFPSTASQSVPKLLYGSEAYGDTMHSQHSVQKNNKKPLQNGNSGHNHVSISESRNECFMDISISKKNKDTNEKTQISRNVSAAIPLKMRNLTAPSNTPVLSRQSSQDWLDKSDQFDCSYD